MKKIGLRILGAVCLLIGLMVIIWILYNLFFGFTEEAKSSSKIFHPMIQGVILLFCWVKIFSIGRIWIQGKTLEEYAREQKERNSGAHTNFRN